ncbi:hypothetical protein PAAG_01240 [Paracoccidioides lutzii Pb01]|uniref:Rootletin n=1 Tax=Paracoccidioides lutzii (strain ATCC MYA-826 / Pb01) TaxID=502779 RepID=C1GRU5_PARBA|nr:hypothetical protein PAAG_01240 [Paracoccidioides lutzii Pb01]EEH38319.2 hypothetical protein PAAG_01240 [Paracoccidioides lutzii Pb01]
MASNLQIPPAENHIIGNEGFPLNAFNDEAALSPMSKKILEKFAIPLAPLTLNKDKDFRIAPTLISRPPDSGFDTSGLNFHFAKPKLPTPNFTSHSKAQRGASIPSPLTTPRVSLNCPTEISQTRAQVMDSDLSYAPACLKERPGGSSSSSSSSTSYSSKLHDVQGTAELSLGPNSGILCISENSVCLSESGNRDEDSQLDMGAGEEDCDLTASRNVHKETRDEPTKKGTSHPVISSPSTSKSRSREPNSRSPHPLPNDTRPRSKQMSSSKVAKRSLSPADGRSSAPTKPVTLRKEPSYTSQPSEEDLFYMLIRKLKKRDEAEAATSAIKERMEIVIDELTQENDNLRCKLRDVGLICKNQKEQINARNSLVERWKEKFSRLRGFVTSVGNDFEILRKEGQLLKSAQDSLVQEKEHINETLKLMHDNTDQLKIRWDQHRATISGVQHECSSLEKSLSTAAGKCADAEKLISLERSRAAMLENYVRNYANRNQKLAAEIQQQQSQTITKIDEIYRHLEGSWNVSQSSMKKEIESGFISCLSLLKSLTQQESVKRQDLESVDNAIRDLCTQLSSSVEVSHKSLETASDLHTNWVQRILTQLTELETAITSSAATFGQLVEARELNGSLQEKLKTVEKDLARVSADCERLISQEETLQRHIRDLEIEIASLQKDEGGNTQLKDVDMSSELQIQLEATSAALMEVTDEIKTKETEMQEMELKLAETVRKLEGAVGEIADLKNEKFKIQEEAQRTEQRVRKELTRANLAAKDQHIAFFEQERHKLRREKVLADKKTLKTAEELAITKRTLMNLQQVEIDNLKLASSKEDSDIAIEAEKSKESFASATKELQSAYDQLEGVSKENEKLKHELSELRVKLATQQEQENMQEALEVLQYEIAEKDLSLLSLKGELSKSEENIKKVSSLQQEVLDKYADITILRERLNSVTSTNAVIANSLEKKNEELAALEQRMETFGKADAEISILKREIEQKDSEVLQLRSQIQEADSLFANAENILRQLGVIGVEESLRDCSDVLQTQLRLITGGTEGGQQLGPTASHLIMPMRTSSKRQGTTRKPTMSSTYAQCAGPGSSTRESKTIDLVYRTRSIRENISSPFRTPSKQEGGSKRQQTTSRSDIKPFSRLQNDLTLDVFPREQSSPMSEFTDLNALFPSTPINVKDVSTRESYTALSQLILTADNTFPSSRGRTNPHGSSVPSISNAVNDVIVASRFGREAKDASEGIVSQGAQSGYSANEAGKRDSFRIDNQTRTQPETAIGAQKRKEMADGGESQVRDNAADCQNPPEKLPRKGILKETVKLSSFTKLNDIKTPPHERDLGGKPIRPSSTITFRRPSRKSKYFNPTMSPTASITAKVGKCGSTANKPNTPAGRARERPRRRPRGELYNNRFSQKTPA